MQRKLSMKKTWIFGQGFALLLAGLLTATVATANDWHVKPGGDDGAAGDSWADAWETIQFALDEAKSGDTIHLAGQTFDIDAQLVWTNAGITMRGGYDPDTGDHDPDQWPTVITRSGAGGDHRILWMDGANDSTLEYVTLTQGVEGRGGGMYIDNSLNVLVSDCVISLCGNVDGAFSFWAGGGLYASGTTEVTLDRCVIRDNTLNNTRDHPDSGAQGGGIYSRGTLTIRDSLVINNLIGSGHSDQGNGGGLYFSGQNLTIFNTLWVENRGRTVGGIEVNSGVATLMNCTIAYNLGKGIRREGGTLSVTNSIVWNNSDDEVAGAVTVGYSLIGDDDVYAGQGNIAGDPLFEYGYYLGTGSPATNAGSATATSLELASYAKNVAGDEYGADEIVNMGYHYSSGFDLTYADIYVAPDGDDGNSGTNAVESLRTLTHALTLARDGSRIHVAAGHYTRAVNETPGETLPLTINELVGVKILGTNASETVFDAFNPDTDHRVMTLHRAHRTVIQGITLTQGVAREGSGMYIDNSRNVLVSDCVISHCGNVDMDFNFWAGGGLYASGTTEVTLDRCVIRDNTLNNTRDHPDSGAQGGGIYSRGTLTIRDSLVINNLIGSGRSDQGNGGGLYFRGQNLTVFNTLWVGNQGRTVGGIEVNRGVATLMNCTIAHNDGKGIRREGGTLSVTNSIVWDNSDDEVAGAVTVGYSLIGDGDVYAGQGNIAGNPLFEYGYYPGTGSPATNAGSATATSLGMASYAKNVAGDEYGADEIVNMGYHYSSGFDLTYADIYVAPDGDDGNSGTNAIESLRTLTHALTLARDGSRIHVAAGHYTRAVNETPGETFPLIINDLAGVKILGTNASETVFDAFNPDANHRVMTLNLAHRTVIQGITLTQGLARRGRVGAGLYIDRSRNVLVSDCVISHCGWVGTQLSSSAPDWTGGGLYASGTTEVTLDRCVIRDNFLDNTSSHSQAQDTKGGGIYSRGTLTIRDSLVINNLTDNGRSDQGRGGGLYFRGQNLTVFNTLWVENQANNRGDGIEIRGGVATLMNCTIAHNDGEGIRRAGGTLSVTNSIVWNNGDEIVGDATVGYSLIGDGAVYEGEGNKAGNPLFVDAAGGDYRLQHGSPAINAGLNQDWMLEATDLAGLPRILNGVVDMGCYESIPPRGTMILLR